MEENLEEYVSQFFFQIVHVPSVDGVDDFVNFLDEIGTEGLMGLGAVPGAASRLQKPVDGAVQGFQVPGGGRAVDCFPAVEEDGFLFSGTPHFHFLQAQAKDALSGKENHRRCFVIGGKEAAAEGLLVYFGKVTDDENVAEVQRETGSLFSADYGEAVFRREEAFPFQKVHQFFSVHGSPPLVNQGLYFFENPSCVVSVADSMVDFQGQGHVVMASFPMESAQCVHGEEEAESFGEAEVEGLEGHPGDD